MAHGSDRKPAGDSVPIGEAGKALGVPPPTIRFWEQEFGLAVPRKLSGRRYFTPRDIALFRRIKELAHDEKLTLPGVRARLEQEGLLAPLPAGAAPPATPHAPAPPPRSGPAPSAERATGQPPTPWRPATPGEPAAGPALPPLPDREQLRSERVQERERRVLLEELKRIRELLGG